MTRPLEIRCPTCGEWCDAGGISDAWECPCGQELPERVEMRGGRLDEMKFAFALEPAGYG